MTSIRKSPGPIKSFRHVGRQQHAIVASGLLAARLHGSAALDHFIRQLPDRDELDPEQVRAAYALLGRSPHDLDRAKRVVVCPLPGEHQQVVVGTAYRVPCGASRACPRCADRRAWRLRATIVKAARACGDPVAVLVTCPSRKLLDLPMAIATMRRALGTLRRRAWFRRAVPRGVLVLETPLTADCERWAVHAHGVLDFAELPDLVQQAAVEARLVREWRDLTGVPGAVFDVEPVRSVAALAGYAVKLGRAEKSWCPPAEGLPPGRRAHLDRALRGKRLVVAWGRRGGDG